MLDHVVIVQRLINLFIFPHHGQEVGVNSSNLFIFPPHEGAVGHIVGNLIYIFPVVYKKRTEL